MYSKTEAAQIKQAFWTAFGKYMSPVLSSEGLKISWVNYHTGFKNLYFRMNADNKKAVVSIELTQPDVEMQQLIFERLGQFRKILEDHVNEEWTWVLHQRDSSGKTISRIYTEINNVSVFNQQTWPEIISFFKPRIIALDEFWNLVKDNFEELK